MELEEMKVQWNAMSQKIATLELINDKKIMEITQLKYKNKFSKLNAYERSGAVVCFLMGFFILFNITRLDTWYLLLCGIATMAFMFILPILSLGSLHRISNMNLSHYNYKEVLSRFEKAKKKVLLIQRTGVVASLFFMFLAIPVADKLLNGNDFFQHEIKNSFWGAIIFGILATFFISRWGLGWYKKITNSAGDVLKDLEE
jgi:amino acid transporter